MDTQQRCVIPSRCIISKKRKTFVVAVIVLFAACGAVWFAVDRGLSAVERSARRAVEDRLARHDVAAVVEGDAGVDLFPRPALVFSDVSVRAPDVETRSLEIDRIEIPVSLQSLWQRSVTVETVVLVRPVIEVRQRGGPARGEPTETDQASRPRAGEDTTSRSDFIAVSEEIGQVQIIDGTIRHGNASAGVSELNGTLILAPNPASASFDGTAVLNGDQTAISVRLDDPEGFAEGADTNLRVSVSSETSTISFDGKGSLRPGLFLDGAFEGSLARPQQVLDVLRGRQNDPARIPPISVRTRLVVEPG